MNRILVYPDKDPLPLSCYYDERWRIVKLKHGIQQFLITQMMLL